MQKFMHACLSVSQIKAKQCKQSQWRDIRIAGKSQNLTAFLLKQPDK